MADDKHGAEEDPAAEAAGGGTPAQAPAHGTPPAAAAAGSAGTAGTAGTAETAGTAGTGGRLEELKAKRRTTGLSDAEAEELGTLLAEQEGKPHSSAQSIKRGPAGGE